LPSLHGCFFGCFIDSQRSLLGIFVVRGFCRSHRVEIDLLGAIDGRLVIVFRGPERGKIRSARGPECYIISAARVLFTLFDDRRGGLGPGAVIIGVAALSINDQIACDPTTFDGFLAIFFLSTPPFPGT
jgi:hypothetical protein